MSKTNWYKKIFGLDFEEEGDDRLSEKDGPISVFLGIVGRKFWSLMKLNLLHSILTVPAFLFSAAFLSAFLIGGPEMRSDSSGAIKIFFGFLTVNLGLVTVGPFEAGFCYVLRLYSYEKNAFILHDYIKAAKDNLKRSVAVSLIDISVIFLMLCGYRFYTVTAGGVGISGVFRVLIVLCAVFFTIMHFYLYPMMVTVDLTVKQLYGNALRFAIGKLFPNLVVLILILGFSFLLFMNPLIGTVLAALIGFSFTGLGTTFYAFIGIDRYIIRKINPEGINIPDLGEDPIKILKR